MSEKILFESRAKLFDELERIAPLMPTPIYWLDKNYVIMGGNDVCLNAIGSNSKNFSEVLAAKTYYDYYPKKIADELTESIRVVLETNQATKTEERIVDVTTGKFRYYETGRAPLHDDKGELVGTICSAIEITAQKEAEHLRSEKLEEQEKFVKTVMQVVHDIRSPLMIIDILSEETSHFPEEQRVLLRNATQRINDITSNLLNTYKSTHQFGATQELPLFVFLSRLFSEKQLQYAKHNIQFKLDISDEAYFAFTVFGLSDLQRILSNLINNAVEAITHEGLITISLKTEKSQPARQTASDTSPREADYLILSIEDNGKGIPESVLDKLGQVGVSYDKTTGTGLGLPHAIETMKKYHGDLQIASGLGKGTKIMLSLPQCKSPDWFAQELKISTANIILILDDDSSIHYLWDKKFAELEITNSIYHFHFDHEFETWASEHPDLLDKVTFLCDNELIGSSLQGLALIEKYQPQVQCSLLVTSYYAFYELAPELLRIQTKLLPKELVMQLQTEFSREP